MRALAAKNDKQFDNYKLHVCGRKSGTHKCGL